MNRAAIIGGGVIGGGWAARFLLNGWDVEVYDPDPNAEAVFEDVLNNARRSLPGLTDVALPPEGKIRFQSSISGAVSDANWIQESVPERLEIKHKVIAEIQTHCPSQSVIGSSTSGFKPSELQQNSKRPGQILVTHPFNPVYLMPLVEVVPSPATDPKIVELAKQHLQGLGMFPLQVRKEIDAHIADRFLEAVWREALWLVKDGVATTEEIDDAIRMGFGIRWAQMGLFETYRTAGGAAGMRHFLAQFGPALKWPWTKLMDVPEFTDELVDLIANQSDAQSGHMSISELLRVRDDNLVAVLRALKGQNWGAGAVLNAQDERLDRFVRLEELDLREPLPTVRRVVPLDWTDYNGHMNEARYLDALSAATDRFMALIGCDADYIAQGSSYFTAETHIRHLGEVHAGDRINIHTQLLAGDGKKLHVWHEIYVDADCVATGEHVLLHVDLETRRTSHPKQEISQAVQSILARRGVRDLPSGVVCKVRPSVQ